MPEQTPGISEADRHLLKQVLAGEEQGWRDLVTRFQHRLLAFSRSKLGSAESSATAEDVVQETFISFLCSVSAFRGDCSLETWLFRILRYRINDFYRQQGKVERATVCEISSTDIARSDLSVSQHAIQREQQQAFESNLTQAIFQLTCEMKEQGKFRDLKVAEGLFYAGLRNQQLAELLSVSANEIAVTKHRLIKRLRDAVGESPSLAGFPEPFEASVLPSLREVWEDQRPSCPKRTTLGKFVLEILPPDWTDFVQFHVQSLGCSYCRANFDELADFSDADPNEAINQQLFQSTIGFLNRRGH